MLAVAIPRFRTLAFARRNHVARPWQWARKYWRRFVDDRDGFQWWISSDEEHYQGPYDTRDEAIQTAIAEGLGDAFNRVPGCQRFYLCEARQGPVELARYIDADDVMCRVAERVDEEFGGEDGLNWDFWTAEQERELGRAIEATVRRWQRRHRIAIRTWAFTATRSAETYTHVAA